ncbi:hypothetical protein IGI04_019360, partial [Brassica rapa subsp. trilocularis]
MSGVYCLDIDRWYLCTSIDINLHMSRHLLPLLLSHGETEAKLCREFPETENPNRRALSPLSRLSSSISLSLRDLSPLSLLLAGAVWWWSWRLQPIGGGGHISQLSCFLVPDLIPFVSCFRSGSRSRLRWSVLNPSCSH